MNLQDCITFASENPVCYIATTDGDQPRVRAVLMCFANENGFYFETLSPKEMSKQLHNNPRIEVCFYNNPTELPNAKMMRITGEIEFVDDEEIKKKVYEQIRFLEDLAAKPIEPLLEVFRIKTGEAHFWTLADILKEPELERIRF